MFVWRRTKRFFLLFLLRFDSVVHACGYAVRGGRIRSPFARDGYSSCLSVFLVRSVDGFQRWMSRMRAECDLALCMDFATWIDKEATVRLKILVWMRKDYRGIVTQKFRDVSVRVKSEIASRKSLSDLLRGEVEDLNGNRSPHQCSFDGFYWGLTDGGWSKNGIWSTVKRYWS